MKKLLLALFICLFCFTVSVQAGTKWIDGIIKVVDGAVTEIKGLFALNTSTNLIESDFGIDIPSITITPRYSNASIGVISNYSRIAPHVSGDGLVLYNGTMLLKYTVSGTRYLKLLTDVAWGTYLAQYWYCTTAENSSYSFSDWTNVISSGVTFSSSLVKDTNDNCVVLKPKFTISNNGQYSVKRATATVDASKSHRLITRIKFPTTGIKGTADKTKGLGWVAVGITDDYVGDGVAVGMFYDTAGATDGNLTVLASNIGETPDAIRYVNSTVNGINDYVDIEIYITSTTFTVKANGVAITNANNGGTATGGTAGAMTIRDQSEWGQCIASISCWAAESNAAASSAELSIKQFDFIEN